MKHLKLPIVAIVLMLGTDFATAQNNQSDGTIDFFFSTPPQQFGGQEIFRFQPGVATQLDDGTFGVGSGDRWFALGHYNAPAQPSYGLRFQTNQKALIIGYNDIGNINPRILWGGEPTQNLGNLEFRVASDFGQPIVTDLVATMRNDGSTIFAFSPNPPMLNDSKVGILADPQYSEGLRVFLDKSQGSPGTAGYFMTENSQNDGVGIYAESRNSQSTGFGVVAQSTGAGNQNYVVITRVGNATGIDYAIFASSFGTPDFAGFFDGDVTVTGTFLNPSDKRLKKDIKTEKNILGQIEKIILLYNCMFKEM